MLSVLKFKCPDCNNVFEFDSVGENEIISCPVCGTGFKTVRKNGLVELEEFNLEDGGLEK
jgi:Zn finger protein HypA/HybF involved in hydrogenase expression